MASQDRPRRHIRRLAHPDIGRIVGVQSDRSGYRCQRELHRRADDDDQHVDRTGSLTGTVELEILGRTFSIETGSWTADIVSMLLTGAVLGNTLTLTDDGSNPSTGPTAIDLLGGDPALYRISSFFDVFVDLTLGAPTLYTSHGPIEFSPRQDRPHPPRNRLCLPSSRYLCCCSPLSGAGGAGEMRRCGQGSKCNANARAHRECFYFRADQQAASQVN